MNQYDVIVSGASVAGLYSGYKLAKAGLKVIILDRREAIGTPVRCGEATRNRREIERFFPYDESYIARELTGLAIHVNDSQELSVEIPDTGVILKREKFEQYIADLAIKAGAKLKLITTVTGLIEEKGTFLGVKSTIGDIGGSFIVAADGAESFLGRSAGLTCHLKPRDAYTALQYRIKSDKFNDGKMHFFSGSESIPNGYIWVFPKGPGEVSVGAGLFGSHKKGEKASTYLDTFIAKHYADSEKYMLISGCAPIDIAPKQLSKANLLIVGDAARMVNPLTAGGIMNALEAADVMGDAIIKSHKTGSLKPLMRYSKKLSGTPRFIQKAFYVMKELYAKSPDSEIIETVRSAATFLAKADRSKLFKIPVTALFPMIRLYAGRFIKWIPWLIRD